MSSEEANNPTQGDAPSAAAKKDKKAPPPGLVIPPKKPKLTKAERRALQEQQRAAKAGAVDSGSNMGAAPKEGAGDAHNKEPSPAGDNTKNTNTNKTAENTEGGPGAKTAVNTENENAAASFFDQSNTKKRLTMVSHLTPYRPLTEKFHQGGGVSLKTTRQHHNTTTIASTTSSSSSNLHPAVLQLGYRYASGEIRGGNARCRHMLACWQRVLLDFQPPGVSNKNTNNASSSGDDLRPVMDALFKSSFQFWTETCRPHSVSMGNAYTMLKTATTSLDRTTSWPDMQQVLLETMQAYARERIDYAGQAIAELACTKLLADKKKKSTAASSTSTKSSTTTTADDATILVYGYSEVVSLVLRQATEQQKAFRVICVDSRPLLEGRKMLEELRAAGVKDCTYILLNALTYVMPNVTMVLCGAAALMSDGSIWNRVGTANVALLAAAHNIPVLVCAESYKISNRVQLEALTHNELGAPPANPQEDDTEDAPSKKNPNLTPLNLLYDLTPASFVSGIVTELGIVPPTSVAVLLRELNSQQQP